MKPNIVNMNNLKWESSDNGDFAYQEKPLRHVTGREMLDTSLYKLMPGKKAFPYHFHYANEEAIFVLEGCGTLRINNEKKPIIQGNYIAFPPGAKFAH